MPSSSPRPRASWSIAQYGDRRLHARPERHADHRCRRAGGRLPRAAPRPDGLRAAPGLSRAGGLRRPAGATRDRSTSRIAEALAEHPDNDDLRAAVVLEASPRKVVAVLQSGDAHHRHRRRPEAGHVGAVRQGRRRRRRSGRGAVVRALQGAKGDWSLTQLPEVEGALVAMDPRSGAIRALVGGFDYGKSKFNHVTQAWRQPGSSFKPFIYSAALEKGFTPATVVNDAPLFFDAGATGSQPWEPKNYDGKFDGPMPLQHRAGEVEEHGLDPRAAVDRRRLRAGLDHALRLRRRQTSGLPDDGAGRRLGDAAADGQRLQRVRQRRLPGARRC